MTKRNLSKIASTLAIGFLLPLLVGVILLIIEYRTGQFQVVSKQEHTSEFVPSNSTSTNSPTFTISPTQTLASTQTPIQEPPVIVTLSTPYLTPKSTQTPILSTLQGERQITTIRKNTSSILFDGALSIGVTFSNKDEDKADVIIGSPGFPVSDVRTKQAGARIKYEGIGTFDILITQITDEDVTFTITRIHKPIANQNYRKVVTSERFDITLGNVEEFFAGKLNIGVTYVSTFDIYAKTDFIISAPGTSGVEWKTMHVGSRVIYAPNDIFDILIVGINDDSTTFEVSLLK